MFKHTSAIIYINVYIKDGEYLMRFDFCSVGFRPFPRTSRGFLKTLTGSKCFELGA